MFDNSQSQRFSPKDGEVWKCMDCGAAIDSLPFEPRRDENGQVSGLRCRDCHSKYKASRGGPRDRR